ncbi:hypothetical protein ABH987_005097 [Bradyrhizobium ottawaense]
MDQHVVADQGALDRGARADIAVPADLDAGPDHRPDADHRAAADLHIRADHGQGIDDHAVLESGRGIDDRRRRDAVIADPGLGPQRFAVPFPRDPDKGPERLRHPQHGHVRGHLGLEARAHQASAGLGRLDLVGVFEVVEERQMHRARFVKRSKARDDVVAPGGVDQLRLGQRGNVSQR